MKCEHCGYKSNSKRLLIIHKKKCNARQMIPLEGLTVQLLRQKAKDAQIEGIYNMKKEELVEALRKRL